MYIQLVRQIAIAIVTLVLLMNCYVMSVSAESKRSKLSATTERTKSRTEKSQSNQNRKDRASKAARSDNSRVKANPKKAAAASAFTREAKRASERRAAEARRAEERRRAEAARLAAIARNEELRERVQSMIAKDDLTGEDPEIRRIAINALGNHAGTVVVMNPQTGRVYSIVNQQWALREGFKPCSTIKLVTTVAGLNEALIDPNDTTKISDNNQVSLTRALAYSSNPYFQTVGEQVGFEKMVAYARRLGLGERTGINARNEFQGRVPGAGSFRAIHRMSSHGDHYEVTALQLATLVSAIGNGGKLLKPYIVRRQDANRLKPSVRRQVKVERDVWSHLVPGMVGAVNYGSGKRAQDPQQQVAGKTGTCIEDGGWVGLFASYAPVLSPKLAVVVITRGADARGHFPAAVAGRIYRELGNPPGAPGNVASRTVNTFETDDEEETVLEEEAEFKVQTATIFRSDQSNPSKVKPVLMSIPVPREVERPAIRTSDEPAGTGGQTRPRRVLGE
jgi:membrane peptidoglycan carboxypeptidase